MCPKRHLHFYDRLCFVIIQEIEFFPCANIVSYFLFFLLVCDCPSMKWYLNSICRSSQWPQILGEIIGWNYSNYSRILSFDFFVETCAHTLLSPYFWQWSVRNQLGYTVYCIQFSFSEAYYNPTTCLIVFVVCYSVQCHTHIRHSALFDWPAVCF